MDANHTDYDEVNMTIAPTSSMQASAGVSTASSGGAYTGFQSNYSGLDSAVEHLIGHVTQSPLGAVQETIREERHVYSATYRPETNALLVDYGFPLAATDEGPNQLLNFATATLFPQHGHDVFMQLNVKLVSTTLNCIAGTFHRLSDKCRCRCSGEEKLRNEEYQLLVEQALHKAVPSGRSDPKAILQPRVRYIFNELERTMQRLGTSLPGLMSLLRQDRWARQAAECIRAHLQHESSDDATYIGSWVLDGLISQVDANGLATTAFAGFPGNTNFPAASPTERSFSDHRSESLAEGLDSECVLYGAEVIPRLAAATDPDLALRLEPHAQVPNFRSASPTRQSNRAEAHKSVNYDAHYNPLNEVISTQKKRRKAEGSNSSQKQKKRRIENEGRPTSSNRVVEGSENAPIPDEPLEMERVGLTGNEELTAA